MMSLDYNEQELWRKYQVDRTVDNRNELVMFYINIAEKYANHIYHKPWVKTEYKDLVQYGVLGLIHAIERFDLGRGKKFLSYASPRIYGAIFDEVRERGRDDNGRRIDALERCVDVKDFVFDRIADELPLPDEMAEKHEWLEIVENFMDESSTGWVLQKYYFDHKLLREMAKEDGRTESMMCLLKRRTVNELVEYLDDRDYLEDLAIR